jgi:hypothetical protein
LDQTPETNICSRHPIQAEPAVVQINRGYALREDLVRACKVAAIEDGKKLYQIMEAALEQYLAARDEEK